MAHMWLHFIELLCFDSLSFLLVILYSSNPVWLGQYDPTWPQQSDKDRYVSDENVRVT